MATRFYLPSTGAAAVSPAYGSWDETANAGTRLRCVTTRINSAPASVTVSKGTGTTRALVRQYVSDPIAAQTIAVGTIKGQIRALESAANDNLDLVSLLVRVCSNDGSTYRGTIIALGDYAAANEFATSLTNRKIADGDATSSVVCSAGDRIVIEIGIKNSASGTSVSGDLSFGDNSGTDLAEDTSTTTANNPWVELSQTITFASFTPDTTAFRFYHDGIETHALAVANDGLKHIPLPGGAVYVSTPHSSALGRTDGYRIRALICPQKWAPGGGVNQTIASKYNTATNRSVLFRILDTGAIQLGWSTDGTALSVVSKALANFPIAQDAIPMWVDIDGTGSGTTWRYAPFDGTDNIPPVWASAGTDGTAIAPFNATAASFLVGAWGSGSEGFNGKVYRVQVLDASGNVIADMRPGADASNGATSWTASTGEVHTCNGTNALAAQSTNITLTVHRVITVLLRLRHQELGGASGAGTDDRTVQVSKNGAGYGTIPASAAAVTYASSASLAVSTGDGAATGNRLGAGAGSFIAGEVTFDAVVDDHQLTAGNHTEDLVVLQLDPAYVANGDTYDFQVNGFAHTVTPRITIAQTLTGEYGKAFANLDGVSSAAAGTVANPVTGEIAANLGGVSSAATGTESMVGTVAATLGGVSSESVGTVANPVTGDIAANLGGVSSAAVGELGIAGTVAAGLGGVSSAAEGVVANPVTGVVASNLGGVSTAASGAVGEVIPDPVVARIYKIGDRVFAVSPS